MKNLVFIIAIALITISSNAQEKQFQKACKENSIEAFNKFIQKYPSSEYTEQAKNALCGLEFKKIQKSESIDLCKNYLEKFADCQDYIYKAREILMVLEYEKAERINTIEAYEFFLQSYPNSGYSKLVESYIQKVELDFAIKENTVVALYNFTSKYPNGSYYQDAIKNIEKLEVESTIRSNSYDTVNRYHSKYPNNVLLIDFLKKTEEVDFNVATQNNNVNAYQSFLKKYPDGYYANSALKELYLVYRKLVQDGLLYTYNICFNTVSFSENANSKYSYNETKQLASILKAWDNYSKKYNVNNKCDLTVNIDYDVHSMFSGAKGAWSVIELNFQITDNRHGILLTNIFEESLYDSKIVQIEEKSNNLTQVTLSTVTDFEKTKKLLIEYQKTIDPIFFNENTIIEVLH